MYDEADPGAGYAHYYTYTDHLGSILTLTDEQGNTVLSQSFDAWGRDRDPATWINLPSFGGVGGGSFEWLNRGYTGHEHLRTFGIINMNGRLYDPALGRMLSPDNYVQGGSQGENRYSYVLNNPLKYSDPSGENPLGLLVGPVVGSLTDAELIALHAAEAAALGAAVATGVIVVAYVALYVADVAQSVQAANTANNFAVQNVSIPAQGSSSFVTQVNYAPQNQKYGNDPRCPNCTGMMGPEFTVTAGRLPMSPKVSSEFSSIWNNPSINIGGDKTEQQMARNDAARGNLDLGLYAQSMNNFTTPFFDAIAGLVGGEAIASTGLFAKASQVFSRSNWWNAASAATTENASEIAAYSEVTRLSSSAVGKGSNIVFGNDAAVVGFENYTIQEGVTSIHGHGNGTANLIYEANGIEKSYTALELAHHIPQGTEIHLHVCYSDYLAEQLSIWTGRPVIGFKPPVNVPNGTLNLYTTHPATDIVKFFNGNPIK
jgi:RHS repeat-associated protein